MSFSDDCADAPFTKTETPDRLTITASNGEEVLVINFAHDAEEREPTEPDVQAETVALMIAHGFVEAEPTPEVRAANAAASALDDQLWELEQAERERNRN
jgi:hypothetical protein